MDNTIIGIILIGGKSTRMGSPKENLTYKNHSFLDIAINLFIKAKLKKIFLSGNNSDGKQNLQNNNIKKITDIIPKNGPLSGIYTISKLVEDNQIAIIIPIDMPKLTTQVINDLKVVAKKKFSQNQTLAIHYQNHNFPLALVFTKDVKNILKKTITSDKSNLSIKRFCESIDAKDILLETRLDKLFDNINSTEDYQDLLKGS